MTGRALTTAAAAAANAAAVVPCIFYEGVYSSGTLRLWSGLGDYTWNSLTWTGAGNLLSISAITENSDVTAQNFTVSLSGPASALLSIALGDARQGLAGRIWLGFFDAAGALIVDPFKAFEGRLDVPTIVDEGEQATITVAYESRLIDLERSRARRYTDEDQQNDYPGDLGFEYVPMIQDAKIPWGSAAPAPAIIPAGGGSASHHMTNKA